MTIGGPIELYHTFLCASDPPYCSAMRSPISLGWSGVGIAVRSDPRQGSVREE